MNKKTGRYLAFILMMAILLMMPLYGSAVGLFDGLLDGKKTENQNSGLFDGLVNPSEKIISAHEQKCLDAVEQMLGASPQITLDEETVWAEYSVSKSKKYALMMYTQDGLQMLAFSPVTQTDLDKLLAVFSQVGELLDFDYGQEEKCLYLIMAPETAKGEKPSEQVSRPPAQASSQTYQCAVCRDLKECPACLGLKACEYCWGEKEYSCTWCIGGECLACDDGQVLIGFDSKDRPRYQKCSQCTGGKCRYCGGDGRMKCESCRGTGKCQTCGGNGKCPICQ